MKLLYNYTIVILLVMISMTSCETDSTTRYVIGDDLSYLVLGSDVTKDELQEIVTEFKTNQDIDIDFDGTEYDAASKVVSLTFKVSARGNEGAISSAPVHGAGFIIDNNNFRVSNNLSSLF